MPSSEHQAGKPETSADMLPEALVAVVGPEAHTSSERSSVPDVRSAALLTAPTGWTGTFEEFFAAHYRTLLRLAAYVGANLDEADEAAVKAMVEVLAAWHRLDDPLAWAKKAVVRFFIKEKTRGLGRIRERLICRHGYPPAHGSDTSLTSWEECNGSSGFCWTFSPRSSAKSCSSCLTATRRRRSPRKSARHLPPSVSGSPLPEDPLPRRGGSSWTSWMNHLEPGK